MSTTSQQTSRAGSPGLPSTVEDGPTPPEPNGSPAAKKGGLFGRGWRKITWVIIFWWVLMAILFIAAASSNHNDCHQIAQALPNVGGSDNFTASCAGEADGGSLRKALELGLLGSVPLSIIWYNARPQKS